MATGNTHTKFSEDRTCSSEDMIADKHTHTQTDRQTGSSQYSAPLPGADDNTGIRNVPLLPVYILIDASRLTMVYVNVTRR